MNGFKTQKSKDPTMECSVCYSANSNCNLVCGHSFCTGCIKTWYNKGNKSCPMCRGNIYFKGMPRKQWDHEHIEEKKELIFQQAFDETLDYLPPRAAIRELRALENTFNAIRDETPIEDLDWIINETGDYYSSRKMRKPTQYGNIGEYKNERGLQRGNRAGRRVSRW